MNRYTPECIHCHKQFASSLLLYNHYNKVHPNGYVIIDFTEQEKNTNG